mgnify:FL=1
MKSIDTEKFRICQDKLGVFGKPLMEFSSEIEANNALVEIKKEPDWNYYCEKEVVYQGTQFDENHNPIVSAPSWIRI